MKLRSLIIGLTLTASVATPALAGDEIRVVGSSTVYPFSTVVAERFGRMTEYATPVVEATGTGGGMKLFCSGVGEDTPDIANASRRIKDSEIEKCAENGVDEIVEVKIGYDGIVLANAVGSTLYHLSQRDIFLALAKNIPTEDGSLVENTYQTWQEINPSLPNIKIEVLGPPPTSGTRDAFSELVLETGCKTFPWLKALKDTDKPRFKAICHGLREDGAYIEAGENDNLIVQKLSANPTSLGIFGFSFLEQNSDKVQASFISEHEATFENIASGDYPVSRSLYFYVKKAHLDEVPGLAEFVKLFMDERAIGEDGFLTERGLIPMGEDELETWRSSVLSFTPIEK
ncbi:MAG: PstS family phosphate ABC transporter substrate-binding protein [Sphingomonadales bacterium]|nr:PstS family phosphate ABC transporter substrate-binding protein [Sphingomonadales bacterium]